jgi:AbrB family looped-hinge helix DNA binding protein
MMKVKTHAHPTAPITSTRASIARSGVTMHDTKDDMDEVRHILLIAMEVAITRMSSKGQVVIPASMRTDLPEGEKILIIREGERIILKPFTDIEPTLRDDILFAEKTERALEEYSKGAFNRKKTRVFIDEMKSW